MSKLEKVTHSLQELREVAIQYGYEDLFMDLVDPWTNQNTLKASTASSAVEASSYESQKDYQYFKEMVKSINNNIAELASSAVLTKASSQAMVVASAGSTSRPPPRDRSITASSGTLRVQTWTINA